jgi:hypothetical protein
MFSALRDCSVPLRLVCHVDPPDALLEAFNKEVMAMMRERIVSPLCQAIETDLRLSIHSEEKQDDRNPYKVITFPFIIRILGNNHHIIVRLDLRI